MTSLLEQAVGFSADLVEIRRDLHRMPELSFNEHRTAGIAAAAVEALGWSVRRNVGVTGVVAELGTDGPVIALRADMDALPIQEAGDTDYRSTVPGVMHACGHDAHVSMLLGAARLLTTAHRSGQLPPGRIRLLFQPSEEASDSDNRSGATRMVEAGAMRGVTAVFGAHVGAHLENGRVFISPGSIMAGSDVFSAVVHGRSSHAARPHEGIDAVVLAAHAVVACQNVVARRLAPRQEGVLTIGMIDGGVAENIVAAEVTLRGTVRYFDADVRNVLHEGLRQSLAVVEALGGNVTLDLRHGYPPVVNDARATDVATRAAIQALGADSMTPFDPMMGAEDFAILAREAPGCFFWIGAALNPPREHHHPAFDIDEGVLPRGAAVLAACAMGALAEFA